MAQAKAGGGDFISNLGKIYTYYTGAFFGFVIVLAILEQLGVQHVIYPESDMGRRVAHLVRGSMQDYLEIGEDFALVKTRPAAKFVGTPLGELGIRTAFGVTITAVKKPGVPWTYADAATVLGIDDVIIVTGPTRNAETFSQLR